MSTVNEETKVASSNTYVGKVVSMIGNKLVMTNKEGREHSHTLAKDATLSCDGTVCKAEDLTAGSTIRVTTMKDNRDVATDIDCLDKDAEFAQCCS